MRTIVDILEQHQRGARGLLSSVPDACTCGELIAPPTGNAGSLARRRAFAEHQAAAIEAERREETTP